MSKATSNARLPLKVDGAAEHNDGYQGVPEHDVVASAALAHMTPGQLAEIMCNRAVIERAKGVLMFIYGNDADKAFEVLKWRSQTTNVKLVMLAAQLIADVGGMAAGDELTGVRSVCDNLLLTLHERVDSLRTEPVRPGSAV